MIKKNRIYIIDNNCLLKHLPYKRQIFPLTQPCIHASTNTNNTLMENFAKSILSMIAYLWEKKQGNSRL